MTKTMTVRQSAVAAGALAVGVSTCALTGGAIGYLEGPIKYALHLPTLQGSSSSDLLVVLDGRSNMQEPGLVAMTAEQWARGEEKATLQVAAGEYEVFDTEDDFLRSLA